MCLRDTYWMVRAPVPAPVLTMRAQTMSEQPNAALLLAAAIRQRDEAQAQLRETQRRLAEAEGRVFDVQEQAAHSLDKKARERDDAERRRDEAEDRERALARYVDQAAGAESCLIPIATLTAIGERADKAEAEKETLREDLDETGRLHMEAQARLTEVEATVRAALVELGEPEKDVTDPVWQAVQLLRGETPSTCPECGYPWPDERVREG